MISTNVPGRFPIPWANGAGAGFTRPIPVASQIGVDDGAASLTDGFPPDTFLPTGAGGIPPAGQDFNGILQQVTQWAQWQATGALVPYDAAFSTGIGGYPKGSRLASSVTPGLVWTSTVENNTSNPDGGSPTGWSGGFTHAVVGGEVLPSGLILNWGSDTQSGSSGGQAVTFAVPFKSAVFQVVASNDAGGPPVAFHGSGGATLTGVTIYSAGSSGVAAAAGTAFRWFAIGV